MHISVEWFKDQFNVSLASKDGAEAFLSIKGCSLKEHGGKKFIGFPARKNEQTGKWWNHVWASDAFQKAVIAEAEACKPLGKQGKPQDDDGGEIPF